MVFAATGVDHVVIQGVNLFFVSVEVFIELHKGGLFQDSSITENHLYIAQTLTTLFTANQGFNLAHYR